MLGPIGSNSGHISSTSKEKEDKSGSEAVKNTYAELRWIPIFTYTPNFFNGFVSFRAQFEIDTLFGVSRNRAGENRGGAFNADQVNIQTKNAFVHWKITPKLSTNVGIHGYYDSVFDPFDTPASYILNSGYKVMFYGTDATGISFYSKYFGLTKLSYTVVVFNKEGQKYDDVQFATLDQAFEIFPGTRIGFSYWYLLDQSQGNQDLYSLVSEGGPSSSLHMGFTGTQKFNVENANGFMNWFGFNFHHNINFFTSRWAANGFIMINKGRYENTNIQYPTISGQTIKTFGIGPVNPSTNWFVEVDGISFNFELQYQYGKRADTTGGDKITFEYLYTQGDNDPKDEKYTGAFTMNYYGLPGTTWVSHKALVLFPFGEAISHFSGAITDISNRGYGTKAFIIAFYYDIIPNKLNIKFGYARATANAPQEVTYRANSLYKDLDSEIIALVNADPNLAQLVQLIYNGKPTFAYTDKSGVVQTNLFREYTSKYMGTEYNFEIVYQIRYLMTVGLHFGKMFLGDFYKSEVNEFGQKVRPNNIDRDPYAIFLTFKWIGF
ncbi:MAG: hypothetical protein NC925_04335 [Candidatus Omnitrophica bacterium]|nr:hypothetical protein [Candidatus Omnitrophota bacterium]